MSSILTLVHEALHLPRVLLPASAFKISAQGRGVGGWGGIKKIPTHLSFFGALFSASPYLLPPQHPPPVFSLLPPIKLMFECLLHRVFSNLLLPFRLRIHFPSKLDACHIFLYFSAGMLTGAQDQSIRLNTVFQSTIGP